MTSNLDRYKADLDKLIRLGAELTNSMLNDLHPSEVKRQLKEKGLSEEQIASMADYFAAQPR